MLRRVAFLLLVATSVGACSWFHHPTPQQQLLNALNRGNSPQVTQIWLSMSEKDRMKFNRGEGITPAVSPKDVVNKLSKMDPDDMQGQVTIEPPNATGGGLMDIPEITNPHGAEPAPTAPQVIEQEP
jgi:hypothetical protein